MTKPDEILAFWLDEVGPKDWFASDPELDAEVSRRFMETWNGAREGRFALWLTYPSGTLAYIILLDQLSRNMFRGKPEAFSTDLIALAAAKSAIQKGWDLRIDEPARDFFYKPLMHSENLQDQDRCVRLICERMPGMRETLMPHAQAHREIIRRFGRFPFRNAALSRHDTEAEKAFLEAGGYAAVMREIQGLQKAA